MKVGEKWRVKRKYLNSYDDIYAIVSMTVEIVRIMPWGDISAKVIQSEFVHDSEEIDSIKSVHREENLIFTREEFLDSYEKVYE